MLITIKAPIVLESGAAPRSEWFGPPACDGTPHDDTGGSFLYILSASRLFLLALKLSTG